MSEDQLDFLRLCSPCDISDALVALEKVGDGEVARGGFLGDLTLRSRDWLSTTPPVMAPAFTVQFQPKSKADGDLCLPKLESSNIPAGKQWSDLTLPRTFVVLQQPHGQMNAAVGGIHMKRMSKLGAIGLIVDGRIRDIPEMIQSGLCVWSSGESTVGAGAQCKPFATQVPVTIGSVLVKPGDLIIAGSLQGVVRVPFELVPDVVAWLQNRGDKEEEIHAMVDGGSSVEDAFKKYR